MRLEVLDDPEAAARRGAQLIARACDAALAERGRFVLAASGGTEPWAMYRELATMPLAWDRVFVVQVDERVAPAGHEERNYTHLKAHLLDRVPIPPAQAPPMPVEEAEDLELAGARYAGQLVRIAGAPPVLDLVHLGLGTDGHTASLVPGDAALEVFDSEVAVAGPYQQRRRMTLTFPALNRARQVLWLVVGASKAAMLARLIEGDVSLPCGRVRRGGAIVIADRAAAKDLKQA